MLKFALPVGAMRPGTAPHRGLAGVMALCMALLLTLGSLAGCASHAGNIDLAVDPSDPCGRERAALSQSRTYFQDQIVAGAARGALIGGVTGALAGAATGNGRNALIGLVVGAAAGGLVGGTAAYYNTMQERYHDQATLARGINADLQREAQEMDHVNATFARLRECRFGVAQQVKYQVRSGQIPREAAMATLGFQRQMFAQEIAVARAYGVNMQKRDQQYMEVAQKLRQQDPSYTPPPPGAEAYAMDEGYTTEGGPGSGPGGGAPRRRRAPTRARPALTPTQQVVTNATESIPEKRTAYVATVDEAEKRGQVAFNIDQPGTGGAS